MRLLSEMRTFVWNNGRPEAMRSYNDDLIMACAVACWVRDTVLATNQRDLEYSKIMAGAIVKSTNELDTRIKGMVGVKNMKMTEDFKNHTKVNEQFPWLLKG